MFDKFRTTGKADFLLGGQAGSEGKGAATAALASIKAPYTIVTTNAAAQAGHTSTHNDVTRVVFHLPTAPLIWAANGNILSPIILLNAGALIDPGVLMKELEDNKALIDRGRFFIHPNAAVITPECREAEGRADSAQTKIASTRKGVGEALSRKVLRSGMIAKDHPLLSPFTRKTDVFDPSELNAYLQAGNSVLVEVPQGLSLSLNGPFYPHCTSRDCTIEQAMSDAGIHPAFYGQSMLVLRCYPIRVGAIIENGVTLGESGGHYPDQREVTWEELKQKPEITTVTKRVRRVFTFSKQQMLVAMKRTRPSVVYLTFCDYLKTPGELDDIVSSIADAATSIGLAPPEIVCQSGPTTDDFVSYGEMKS